MLVCTAKIVGVSQLMFGGHVSEKKKDDETHEQHDERTWRQKIHADKDGNCYLPPFALKNCLEEAAKWLGMKIPGEGKKNFTARFVAGILVVDRLMLCNGSGKPIKIGEVQPLELFVPSDGKRGSGKRVPRIFPTIDPPWTANCTIHCFDNKISLDILQRHLDAAGKFRGFGAMRVGNGGINGRWGVENLKGEEVKV